MPCRDGRDDTDSLSRRRTQLVDAMLCAVLTELERRTPTGLRHYLDPIDWTKAGVGRAELELWWDQHKEQDRIRRAMEAQRRREEALRDQAMKKLTGEELAVLRKLGVGGPPLH